MPVQLRVIGIIRLPVRSTYIELNEPSSNMGVIFQAAKIVTEIYYPSEIPVTFRQE